MRTTMRVPEAIFFIIVKGFVSACHCVRCARDCCLFVSLKTVFLNAEVPGRQAQAPVYNATVAISSIKVAYAAAPMRSNFATHRSQTGMVSLQQSNQLHCLVYARMELTHSGLVRCRFGNRQQEAINKGKRSVLSFGLCIYGGIDV